MRSAIIYHYRDNVVYLLQKMLHIKVSGLRCDNKLKMNIYIYIMVQKSLERKFTFLCPFVFVILFLLLSWSDIKVLNILSNKT